MAGRSRTTATSIGVLGCLVVVGVFCSPALAVGISRPGELPWMEPLRPTGWTTVTVAGFSNLTPTLPAGITHYLPIRISNHQAVGTGAPFSDELTVNSSSYSAYETARLRNVEFFTGDGHVVPSWLESGDSSLSNASVYWLNLSHGIGANSFVVVFMGFGNGSMMNRQTTGEAPGLTSPLAYGRFDDGAAVFPMYSGYEGTSVPSIVKTLNVLSGSGINATISNGLHYSVTSNAAWYGARTNFTVPAGPFVFDMDQSAISPGSGSWYSSEWAGMIAPCCTSTVSNPGRIGGEGYWSGFSTRSPSTPTDAVFGFVTGPSKVSGYWYSGAYSTNTSQSGGTNFLAASTLSGSFSGLFAQAGSGEQLNVTFDWMRERTLEPGGTMPVVVFGPVV